MSEPIGAMKVDVENYEALMFAGARKLLERDHPPILCELWNNENRVQVVELLADIGYGCFVREGRDLIPYDAVTHAERLNFFFVTP